MPNHSEELVLAGRAARGDQAAFAELYTRLLDDVFRYVYYRLSNRQDAEDLTEQVFLRIWENLPRYDNERLSVRALGYRIAHNLVVDHYRTRRNTESLADAGPLVDGRPGPEARLLEQEQSERLARVVARLSPIHQHVLVLRFISGLSVAEVADIVERSEGAVRVLQHRALKAAQAYLAAEETVHAQQGN